MGQLERSLREELAHLGGVESIEQNITSGGRKRDWLTSPGKRTLSVEGVGELVTDDSSDSGVVGETATNRTVYVWILGTHSIWFSSEYGNLSESNGIWIKFLS